MSPRNNASRTIRKVLFRVWRGLPRRCPRIHSELHAYRRVLFFLELCINNYGHRNLNPG